MNEVSWIGGAEGALIDLVTNLDSQHYMPIVVSPGEGELTEALKMREIDTISVSFYGLKARNPLRYFQTIMRLRSIVSQNNVDLIHVNQQYFSDYGVALSRVCRIPVVVHLRGVETDEFYDQFAGKIIAADAVIAVSEAARSRLLEYVSLKMGQKKAEIVAEQARVIYDGFKAPEKGLSAEDLHQEFEIPQERKIVGIVGQVIPEKGLWEFVDAVDLVLKSGRDVQFVVVGSDPDRSRDYDSVVEARVRELGIESRFTFTGFRRDAAALIQGMDVSVLASWQDAFPRVVLESLAAETPVVATRVGGVPEMVEDGVSGLLVKPRDSEALAEGIISILEMDNEQRREMVERGKKSMERFSVEEHVRRVTDVYCELMKS